MTFDQFDVPSFGAGEFLSLVVDGSNEALQAANASLDGANVNLISAQDAVDGFFQDGAGSAFEDLGDLQSVASDLRTAETEADRLEGEVSGAQGDVDDFFVDGAGADFDDLDHLGSVASGLREDEGVASSLEDAAAEAQGMVDNFFADGEGSEFADSSAMETAISDLRGLEGQGQAAEGNIVTAQGDLAAFFSGLNSDSALNLKDGTVYTVSGDIADEVAALETLLNDDEDAVYSADRVTTFLNAYDGIDNREIADLADLNGQIDHSVVMREMSVSDAAPQLVSLDEAEVDRLGEGSVQIEARQTDAVGNLHDGAPATSSFVIDTIDPAVSVSDDQDGTAFDGANTVTYTLSFSEAVRSVTETDLTVTGAAVDAETGEPVYSVTHTPDTATASVTVTVADNSMEKVSVSVNSSILDIAGNPLIQVVDNSQNVDTV
ncbi:MAG: hypothetical protein VX160_05155, partial [Actinomycetota bacterium]|nr:hypothetical protein [Actinomycetota bacterium]